MKFLHGCIFLTLVLLVTDFTEARIFGRRRYRRSYYNYNYNYSGYNYNNYNVGGTPQEVAEQKARIQANSNSCFHPGGSFGGCNFEGVGSGFTPAQALANCCYSGYRTVAAEAVFQGSNGMYYACRLFW